MRGTASWIVLVVLSGCGDIVKKVDGGLDDGGAIDDGEAVDGDVVDGPPIDVPPGAPNIADMIPDWGSMAGGTNVKLVGVGFAEPNLVVRFGTVPAQSVTVVSDTELRVVTAAGPHAPVDVSVTTSGGVSTFPVKFRNLAPLYGADSRKGATKNLYRLDPANGQAVTIGAMGAVVTGLALSPTGIMYAMAGPVAAGQPNRLVTVNVYTGALTTVGNLPNGSSPDIAFVGNQLVGWGGPAGQPKNRMATINTTTVAHTYAAASMTCSGCGMAATSGTSMVFAPASAKGILYTVNTSNGVPSAGPTMNSTLTPNEAVFALTFVGPTLYAAIGNFPTTTTQTNRLVSINPQTGAITARGNIPLDIDAIEGIPTQPVIPNVVGSSNAELSAELATTLVRLTGTSAATVETTDLRALVTPEAAPPMPTVVWQGRRVQPSELLALGSDRMVGDRERRIVPLSAIADGAGTVVLYSGREVRRVAVVEGLAIALNNRGELKLVDTRIGGQRMFGPITEVRSTR